ncbi:MAG: hypothetical protein K8H84_00470 [Sulfuricella denitrificans]|nr:hypothetical protein [Sulfuricella denitrificans]
MLKHGILVLLALLATGAAIAQPPEAENKPAHTQSTPESVIPPVKTYRKTLTLTRFQVVNSIQVEDIPDIWDGYPLELLRRLESSGNVVARHSTASPFPDLRNLYPDAPASRELIRRIAEQNGTQLVLSGLILDAAVSNESLRPYAGWQGGETGRRFELGLPWNSVVAGVRPVATERRFEVLIFLHDGQTGALLKSHRNSAETSGLVAVGRNKPFASAAFFNTSFGQAVDNILDTQVGLIDADLAGVPFMANIVRIDGRKVFIDAGSMSALQTGDKLRVYHRNPATTLESPASLALGIPELPVAMLTLNQVHPLFAEGELSTDATSFRVQAGDVVRFEGASDKQ